MNIPCLIAFLTKMMTSFLKKLAFTRATLQEMETKFRFVIHKESGKSNSITKSQGARLLPHSRQSRKLYAKINRYKTLS